MQPAAHLRLSRESRALLDRFDLVVAMPRPRAEELAAPPGEPSAAVRARVVAGRARLRDGDVLRRTRRPPRCSTAPSSTYRSRGVGEHALRASHAPSPLLPERSRYCPNMWRRRSRTARRSEWHRSRERGNGARDTGNAGAAASRERHAVDGAVEQRGGRLGPTSTSPSRSRARRATTRARTDADASPGGAAAPRRCGRGIATTRSKRSSSARDTFSR